MNKMYFDCTDGIREFHITHVRYATRDEYSKSRGKPIKGGLTVKGYLYPAGKPEKAVRFYYSNYSAKIAKISITAIMNVIDNNQRACLQQYIQEARAYKNGLTEAKPSYPYYTAKVDADCDITLPVEVSHYNGYIQMNFNEYQFIK